MDDIDNSITNHSALKEKEIEKERSVCHIGRLGMAEGKRGTIVVGSVLW